MELVSRWNQVGSEGISSITLSHDAAKALDEHISREGDTMTLWGQDVEVQDLDVWVRLELETRGQG